MLYSHKTSPVAEYECPLTQCTTAGAMHLSAGMTMKWQGLAVGGISGNTAKLHLKSAVPLLTNCMLWQAMQICTRVQQFLV